MVQRTRTRVRNRIGGASWHPSNPAGTLTHVVYKDLDHTTVDFVQKLKRPDGSLPSSNFDSDAVYRRPGTISRSTGAFNWHFAGRQIYESYSPDRYLYPLRGSTARNQANNKFALELIASSHPFAPVFSIPVALKELAEIAGMFKLAARTFAGFAGGAYLNYRFGWKAFYRDVQTLAHIMRDIERRMRWFNQLLERGETRVNRKLDTWRKVDTYTNSVLHSAYGTPIYGSLRVDKSMKTWGSLRWLAVGDIQLPLDELERFNLAVRTVFDLGEIDPPTLWEMLPFSWLVDYFYDVGSALQSQHMRYQLQPLDICIMRHYRQEVQTTVTSKPASVTIGSEGWFLREIKSRDAVPTPSTPSLSFDLLTADRWKVLLALAAKFRG